ncbi:hypothetical protein L208DRAFT_513619 [Tricholoma matsutake]|nr:hypothetical protein L208DRAFT_513619 [Tricholoma matsutake 945]
MGFIVILPESLPFTFGTYYHNDRVLLGSYTSECFGICSSLSSFHQYYAVIVQIIVGFLLILRTYALYDRSWRALLFMLVVAGGVIVLGTWTVVKGVHGPEPNSNWTGVGCVPSLNKAPAIRYAAAWSGALVFDIVIFTMTIYKSVRRSRVGNRSLTHILLRDGAIYFGIMAAVTLSNILSFLVRLSPLSRCDSYLC